MKDIKIQRIRDLLSYLETERIILSQREFAEMLGIKPSSISEMLTGKRTISEKTIHKIASTFPQVNEGWLLSGEGKMLNAESNLEAVPAATPTNVTIQADAWQLIMDQHEMLKARDKQVEEMLEAARIRDRQNEVAIKMRDRQIDEVIALLRDEIKKSDDHLAASFGGVARLGAGE